MSEWTTVKISRATVKKIVALQRSLHTGSIDETIEVLLRRRRKSVLDDIAGTDPVKSRKFSEGDRLENHSRLLGSLPRLKEFTRDKHDRLAR